MKKKFFLIILLSFLAVFGFLLFLLVDKAKADPGWLSGWGYRKQITIDNTGNSNNLTDYQVLVTIDTNSLILAGKMLPNCDDIRFTDSDGTTDYNCTAGEGCYWIESGCGTASTKIWVKVPSIAGSSQKTMYMYYGNPAASSASNGTNTFVFFNDFSSNPSITTPSYSTNATDNYISYDGTNDRINYKAKRQNVASGVYGEYPRWFDITDFTASNFEFSFDWKVTGSSYAAYATHWYLNFSSQQPANQRNDGGGSRIGVHSWIDTRYTTPPAISGYSTAGSTDYVQSLSTNTTYRVKVIKDGTNLTIKVYQGDTLIGSQSTTIGSLPATWSYVLYMGGSGGNSTNPYEQGFFDDFRVRKYASPEPSISSIGAEEEAEIITYSRKATAIYEVLNNSPSAINLSATPIGDCFLYHPYVKLEWSFSDPDLASGDYQSARQVEIFSDPGYNNLVNSIPQPDYSPGSTEYAPNTGLSFNTDYYWRVRVWDNEGALSDCGQPEGWCYSEQPSFHTEKEWPWPDFSVTPLTQRVHLKERVEFTDESTCYDGPCNLSPTANYLWEFGDGGTSLKQGNTSHIYLATGNYDVTLTITDEVGSCTSDPITITVTLPLPEWKEIAPF